MKREDIQDGWYKPDLGTMVDLPEDFLVTMESMKEACIQADKYAEELALAYLSLPSDDWVCGQ